MTTIALITSASGGLGQALARELRDSGWKLALVGRAGDKLRKLYGDDDVCITADVSTA